jgi:hypothetical protein
LPGGNVFGASDARIARPGDTGTRFGAGHRAGRKAATEPNARCRLLGRIPCPAVNWLIWIPLIVLGTLLVLFGLTALLGRVAGGRYLRPIVAGLSKVPFLRRMFERMSIAALERENPELASAMRKLQRFGTPTTPEAAQRALARLTPGERRAYLQAAGQQADMPEASNRAARRKLTAVQPPPGSARPGASGRKKRKR